MIERLIPLIFGGFMRIGFIGLGRMGQGMASRLLGGGHELLVYNRSAGKIKGESE